MFFINSVFFEMRSLLDLVPLLYVFCFLQILVKPRILDSTFNLDVLKNTSDIWVYLLHANEKFLLSCSTCRASVDLLTLVVEWEGGICSHLDISTMGCYLQREHPKHATRTSRALSCFSALTKQTQDKYIQLSRTEHQLPHTFFVAYVQRLKIPFLEICISFLSLL